MMKWHPHTVKVEEGGWDTLENFNSTNSRLEQLLLPIIRSQNPIKGPPPFNPLTMAAGAPGLPNPPPY